MSKAVTFLKYTGAFIVFEISYMTCSVIAHLGVWLVNFDARGFWIDFLPYFAAFMAGIIGVGGGLYAVERLFPTVRPRTVAWIFIGSMSLIWGFVIFALLMGIGELLDETPPIAVQALTSVIFVWKLTKD